MCPAQEQRVQLLHRHLPPGGPAVVAGVGTLGGFQLAAAAQGAVRESQGDSCGHMTQVGRDARRPRDWGRTVGVPDDSRHRHCGAARSTRLRHVSQRIQSIVGCSGQCRPVGAPGHARRRRKWLPALKLSGQHAAGQGGVRRIADPSLAADGADFVVRAAAVERRQRGWAVVSHRPAQQDGGWRIDGHATRQRRAVQDRSRAAPAVRHSRRIGAHAAPQAGVKAPTPGPQWPGCQRPRLAGAGCHCATAAPSGSVRPVKARHPGNGSWTRPSGLRCGGLARRVDAAG